MRRLSGHKTVVAFGLVLIVGLWLYVWYQINYDYEREIAEASRESMNLARTYESHVRGIFREADKSLIALGCLETNPRRAILDTDRQD